MLQNVVLKRARQLLLSSNTLETRGGLGVLNVLGAQDGHACHLPLNQLGTLPLHQYNANMLLLFVDNNNIDVVYEKNDAERRHSVRRYDCGGSCRLIMTDTSAPLLGAYPQNGGKYGANSMKQMVNF
jgi:hypothetical protein